jgi:hypothetical protein
MLGNQLSRAATLAQLLLTQYPDDPESTKLANEVIAEARTKLARISVVCSRPCSVAIGGRATSLDIAASHVVFTPPGHQSLEIMFDGDRGVTRELTMRAGEAATLPIDPPPAPPAAPAAPAPATAAARSARSAPPPAPRSPPPLPPRVALGAGAVTLVLAGIATWSGLDTLSAHDAYAAAPSPQGWSDGRSKQLRTNVLLGAAAAAGVTTALIAVFWTRWDSPHAGAHEVAITPASGGLSLSLGGRF